MESDFNIERANQYSWPLYHAPAVLFPRFFGNDSTYWGKKLQIEQGFFIGTLPLLLALLTLFRKKLAIGHWSLGFWKWLTVFSFLLALGSLSPFRLIGIEPSLWFFSAPTRWLLFTTFGLSTLAAFGWDKMMRVTAAGAPRQPHGKYSDARLVGVKQLAGPALFLLIIFSNLFLFLTPDSFFLSLNQNPEEYYQRKVVSLLTSLRTSSVSLLSPYTALPIIILVIVPFVIHRRLGKQVLLAVTTAELVLIASTTNPLVSWDDILTPPASVAQLPDMIPQKQARLHGVRTAENTGKHLTNPESLENATTRRQLREQLVPLIHAQFNLPGVAWPASLDLANASHVLHQLNEDLKQGKMELAEELNIGAVLTAQEGVRELSPKPRASLLLTNDVEIAAEYKEHSSTEAEIETHSDLPATLIVRDTYYPGWSATIDGQAAIVRAHGIFREVSVPAGSHRVTMKYRSSLITSGIGVSLMSLVLCGWLMYKRNV